MKFSGEFKVFAERCIVFERLNDAKFFASCLEGVSDLNEIDPTHFKATIETRIAYIKFKFSIAVELIKVEAPIEVVARAEGAPLGMVGRLTAVSSAVLREDGRETIVAYAIDVALAGKLGSIGQPVLMAKAREMERSFVRNLNAVFATSPAREGNA